MNFLIIRPNKSGFGLCFRKWGLIWLFIPMLLISCASPKTPPETPSFTSIPAIDITTQDSELNSPELANKSIHTEDSNQDKSTSASPSKIAVNVFSFIGDSILTDAIGEIIFGGF